MTHSKIQHYGPLVARVLLALLFIVSGAGVLMNLSGTASYFAALGIPMAMIVAILVVIVKIGGGLMLATGIHAKEGAWALIVFTVLATLIGHTGDGQLVPALKNLSIVGGLLMVVIYGSGPLTWAKKCPCPKCKVANRAETSAAGGVCNCGNCPECREAKADSQM